jgi:hypothetical protein
MDRRASKTLSNTLIFENGGDGLVPCQESVVEALSAFFEQLADWEAKEGASSGDLDRARPSHC